MSLSASIGLATITNTTDTVMKIAADFGLFKLILNVANVIKSVVVSFLLYNPFLAYRISFAQRALNNY